MDVARECLPCTLRSCLRLLDSGCLPDADHEQLLRAALSYLAEADWGQSPPALARGLHARLREISGDPDPYRTIKQQGNLAMLARRDELRARIAAAGDPFAAALRLAVAGNVIDFGAQHFIDIDDTVARVLDAPFAIDHAAGLREALDRARSVLYVGDNAGEIVLDALFLETVAHDDVTFLVRGAPVLNDATREDALLAGIDRLARVATTGDDSPGLAPSRAPAEIRALLAAADLVIAKGQGNLEGLWDLPREVVFLLTVKCERIAGLVGVPVGEFVAWRREAPARQGGES